MMDDKAGSIIRDSVIEACENNGQDSKVAEKIIAWVTANSERDVDPSEHEKFAQIVLDAIDLGGQSAD